MTSLPVPVAPANVVEFQDHLASAAAYALADKSDATRRAYTADFTDFTAWCGGLGAEPLPASVATVAAYLASLADRGLKASTITRRAAAIGYVHRRSGHEPPTNAEPVKAVLKGIRRKLGTAVTRKAPATAKAIGAMLKQVPDSREGKRDRALLLIGFAAALRRSEWWRSRSRTWSGARRPAHHHPAEQDRPGGRGARRPHPAGRQAPAGRGAGGVAVGLRHPDRAHLRPDRSQRRQHRQAVRGSREARSDDVLGSLAASRLRDIRSRSRCRHHESHGCHAASRSEDAQSV